jgi:hypothetical protein
MNFAMSEYVHGEIAKRREELPDAQYSIFGAVEKEKALSCESAERKGT